MRQTAMDPHAVILTLPLSAIDRADFMETAKTVFERILDRIEPHNVGLTRALWDPGHYVDNHLLTAEMLPIERDYALSLIDAFLVHHVVDLAIDADNLTERLPTTT
ncbi:hypothetical protein [Rhizobium mongolense]|uniref:hypothetical protein n=1 Tax=Rhizobium mongolense TaxID=57676 RepID=UPI0034A1AC20